MVMIHYKIAYYAIIHVLLVLAKNITNVNLAIQQFLILLYIIHVKNVNQDILVIMHYINVNYVQLIVCIA